MDRTRDELAAALARLYGQNSEASQAVLRMLGDAVIEAHKESSQNSLWCWTLTTPMDQKLLRLNIHNGSAPPKKLVTILANGDVEFIVDRVRVVLDDIERKVHDLCPTINVGPWKHRTAKQDSDRCKVIVAKDHLQYLRQVYNLITDARVATIRKHARGPAKQNEHNRMALDFIREELNDSTIPDPDMRVTFDALLASAEQDIAAYEVEEGARTEGAMTTVLTNRYERDATNRAAAIAYHGTRCQVCGFSFVEVYGPRGEGYIEVHHKKPISSYGGEVLISPKDDLAVLCANCHSMIHRFPNAPLSIDDLTRLVKQQNERD